MGDLCRKLIPAHTQPEGTALVEEIKPKSKPAARFPGGKAFPSWLADGI